MAALEKDFPRNLRNVFADATGSTTRFAAKESCVNQAVNITFDKQFVCCFVNELHMGHHLCLAGNAESNESLSAIAVLVPCDHTDQSNRR